MTILDSVERSTQVFSFSVMSIFRTKEPEVKAIAPRQADINIFTVASGLLYEVKLQICARRGANTFTALRFDYDTERPAEYE